LAERKQVKIVREEGAFNWSRLNNAGASSASGEVLVFLNNDVEITKEGWLRELVSQAWREDVGAVGACLLFPDGNIQHAGVVLGITGVAGHVFRGGSLRDGHTSIAGSASRPREVTAVTGACMAVRATLFKEVGGFDADNLPVNYNDIDFCLRLRARGLRNIYTPFACLVHHESVSRAALERQSARKEAATEEARIVLSRWPQEFAQDAFFNPNLDKNEEWPSFESATPAGEPVDGAPWE
jgi:GT2 family glycosyltransferase